MLNNLDNINGKRYSITLPTDEEGMLGRECPAENCLGYFKIKPGTGIKDDDLQPTCPYCGIKVDAQDFSTQEQIEYAKSLVMREVQKALGADLRNWGKSLERSTRGGFLQIKVDYKSTPMPIRFYEEKELETTIACEQCGLVYSVFGKFAYCPDCGIDNTIQILSKNLELVNKLLSKAREEENPEFQEFLVHNALEDIVSSFDSFGRNSVQLFTKNTDKSDLSISFQNIRKAHERILKVFDFDFRHGLPPEDWEKVVKNFQKRHLISHNDGIVDAPYIQITNDKEAVKGRKIRIASEDVEKMLGAIEIMAHNLQKGLSSWKQEIDEKGENNA
jgi:rubredoxin